jgi:hypothetical protein
MPALLHQGEHVTAEAPLTKRLLVTRRDPDNRRYVALGFLSCSTTGYDFAYFRAAVTSPDFQPLPGLSRTDGPYSAQRLFPVFAERVMSSRRPDRRQALASLGLPETAAPFEVLVNSGGRSVGDAVELLPAPTAAPDGSLALEFLVHGVRHMSAAAQARITKLVPGESLLLVPEPSNPVNSRARLVTDDERVSLGYVPDPLLPVIEQMHASSASVVRANDERVGFHFRLTVRVEGNIGAGAQPFDGPEWALAGTGHA